MDIELGQVWQDYDLAEVSTKLDNLFPEYSFGAIGAWAWGFCRCIDALEKLKLPITLDGYTIRPPEVKLMKAEGGVAHLQITIHEGRNRQVRRMCEAAGMHVTRLRRIREGSLCLGDLPKGKWRYLTKEEVAALK